MTGGDDRQARPRGVIGAEVWVKVAAPGDPPPSDAGELKFLLLSTHTPAVAEFTGPPACRLPAAEAGQTSDSVSKVFGMR